MGLKAGIYSSAGTHTCALQFGSLGYEQIDAQTYADWGFDYLKYDNCFSAGQHGSPDVSFKRFKKMSDALLAAKRDPPLFLSLCNWGQDQAWTWAPTISNSWRSTGDIDDTFDEVKPQCPETAWTDAPEGYGCSIANIVNKASPIMQKAVRGACRPMLPFRTDFGADLASLLMHRLVARPGYARGRPRWNDDGRIHCAHVALGPHEEPSHPRQRPDQHG